jgi:hypothetical protein
LSLAVYPEECGNAPVDYKMPAMVAISVDAEHKYNLGMAFLFALKGE